MNRLVIDIETFTLDDAAEFIEEPTAPANYKDQEKIAAYVAEAKQKALTRCALDPDLCCIVAIGIFDPGVTAEPTTLLLARDSVDEAAALQQFWDITAGRDYIGFNILAFDLPILMRRSQYLGLDYRHTPVHPPYRSPHTDLMDVASFNGAIKERSLNFYCKRFGIDVPDPTTGRDIDAMVKAQDWTGIAQHCRADLQKTRLLAERLGVLPRVELPAEVVL